MGAMKHLFALLVLAVAALPVSAADEQPLSPAEFREYAEGYTLYFSRDGEPFGSERFEPGGKTRWRYRDGSCVHGAWRSHGAQVCFLYEAGASGDDRPLCWRVLLDEEGMFARLLEGDNAGLELRVTSRDRKPLLCGAPGTST